MSIYSVGDYTDWKSVSILSLSFCVSPLRISTHTADQTRPSFKRESSSDVERSPHNYANVTFAFEVARGRSPREVRHPGVYHPGNETLTAHC